jgi:ketosteroid isomerase-like protein
MTNRDIIMALYAAFDSGDMDAVLALMADDLAAPVSPIRGQLQSLTA